MKTPSIQRSAAACRHLAQGLASLLLGLSCACHADSTDISNTPINSTRISLAKPNIMVLMDTSVSMNFTHAPDDLEGGTAYTPPPAAQPVGYRSNQCNSLYYDPGYDYTKFAPVDVSGIAHYPVPSASGPSPSFENAQVDFYIHPSTTLDLRTGFQAFDATTRAYPASDTAQRAYYYVYTGTATLSYASAPCTDVYNPALYSVATTGGSWRRVLVGDPADPSIADKLKTLDGVAQDERQNFAMWYTYYRTRIALSKSGIGLAFASLGVTANDSPEYYRVGFITANPLAHTPGAPAAAGASVVKGTATAAGFYVPLGAFTTDQKKIWYFNLYAQSPAGTSPMREGLARVGRHYADKHDGINLGMAETPSVYSSGTASASEHSCQQNFAIMTTDGYWNNSNETAGPVQIDGVTLIGQKDGALDAVDPNGYASNATPRPIWDGGTTGQTTTTAKTLTYAPAVCTTPWITKIVSQDLQGSSQLLKSTTQVRTYTVQSLQTTHRMKKSTSSSQKQTVQITQTVTQSADRQVALTNSSTTRQKEVLQYWQNRPTIYTTQLNITTSQMQKTVSQVMQTKTQAQQTKTQAQQSTSQVQQTKAQVQQTKVQVQQTRVQVQQTTSQVKQTVTQVQQSTAQTTATTSRVLAYLNEQYTPVASCPTVPGGVLCINEAPVTSNVVPGTCVGAVASAANSYVTTTCVNTNTGPTSVQNCTPVTADGVSIWMTTTCTYPPANNTGPTFVATCSPGTGVSPNWITTSCTPVAGTGPTSVASCAAATGPGPNYITTTCSYPGANNTGPTPVQTCANVPAAAPDYTATTCTYPAPNNSGPTSVQTCSNATATAPNWISTSCTYPPANNTGPTFVATCAAVTGTSPNWITTGCTPIPLTGPTSVASCTPTTGPGPAFIRTSCSYPTANNTGPTSVPTCTSVSAVAPDYIATTCTYPPANNSGPTAVQTCSNVTGTAPNWISTSCTYPPANNTGPTFVATCAAVTGTSPNWITTGCTPIPLTGPTSVASCTPTTGPGPAFIRTSCSYPTANNTGPTFVATCAAVTGTSPNWITSTCTPVPGNGPLPTGACNAATGPGPNYITTTCSSPVVSGPTAAASCTPVAINSSGLATLCGSTGTIIGAPCTSSGNVTCASTVLTAWTAVASCTASGAPLGAPWQETVCRDYPTLATPVATCPAAGSASVAPYTVNTCVASYTPSDGSYSPAACTTTKQSGSSPFITTQCQVTSLSSGFVDASTCVSGVNDQLPNALNSFTTITCSAPAAAVATKASTCTGQTPSALNHWKGIYCTWTDPIVSYAASTSATVFSCITAPASTPFWTQTTCTPEDAGPTAVPWETCAPVSIADAGNSYTSTVCNDSPLPPSGSVLYTPVDPALCPGLEQAASANNGWTQTVCDTQVPAPTGSAPADCANDVAASSANSWLATTCHTSTTGPTPVANCTPSGSAAAAPYLATTCTAGSGTGSTTVPSGQCATTSKTAGPDYIGTTCTPVMGQQVAYQTGTTVATNIYSGAVVVGSSTSASVAWPSTPVPMDGVCRISAEQTDPFWAAPAGVSVPVLGMPPVIPSTVPTSTFSTLSAVSDLTLPVGCSAWPCADTVGSVLGGSSNSLADVAQYYYITDLRPDLPDNVYVGGGTGPEDDRVKWQHMTTFTVGLGVSGTLDYRSDYQSSGSGDFAALRSGTKSWPVWPTATATTDVALSNPRSIDDFWHAAVNGRGGFFSASNASDLQKFLVGALSKMNSASGAGGAAASATQAPVLGANTLFTTGFTSGKWTGDVQSKAFTLTATTAGISQGNAWSAQPKLDQLVSSQCDTRDIRLFRHAGGTTSLVNFTWNTWPCDTSGAPTGTIAANALSVAEKAYFGLAAGDYGSLAVANLSQFAATGSSLPGQLSAAKGANLVNFLRGQRGHEGYVGTDTTSTKLYRSRDHVLGDIVNSSPTYVKAPALNYADTGYASWIAASAQVNRAPMVYVGANDGMLHAFYTDTSTAAIKPAGTEAWAVIPTPVVPNLAALADVAYGSHHQYYV
ncbi:MAG: PilC/PilY family type IV pilus protein, partial [Betaproteobacteria bacterium]